VPGTRVVGIGALGLSSLEIVAGLSGAYPALNLSIPILASVPFFFTAAITCAAVAQDVDDAFYRKSTDGLFSSRGPRIIVASPLGIFGVW